MLIGITGKMLTGKSTVANIIQELCPEYVVDSFADPLKAFCADILQVDRQLLEDQEFKKSTLSNEWDMSVREFLQKVGVGMRETVHPNFWINAYFTSKRTCRVNASVRFLNEAAAITGRKGFIIKVENPRLNNISTHSSETELELIKYKYLIVNDGTIEQLREKVGNDILAKEKMI